MSLMWKRSLETILTDKRTNQKYVELCDLYGE